MESLTNKGAFAKPTVPRKRSRSVNGVKSKSERHRLRQSVEAERRCVIRNSSQIRSGMTISCCHPSCTLGSSLDVSVLSAASPICNARHPDWIMKSTTLEVGRKRPAGWDGLVNSKVKVVCPSDVVVNLVLRRSADSHRSLKPRENSHEAVAGKDDYITEKRSGDVVRQSKLNIVLFVGLRSFPLFWLMF